jgi:RNA polymerase primary sigma factor
MCNEELVREIQAGNESREHMEQLYLNNKGMIYRTVKKYQNIDSMTDIDDLMQQAYFGLVEAVQRYDEAKDASFITYAIYWIRNVVKRYMEKCGRSIYLPVHTQEKIYRYNQVTSHFLCEFNREPTEPEYCYYLDITQKKLESLRHTMRISSPESIETPLAEQLTIKDTIMAPGDDMETTEDKLDNLSLSSLLWDEVSKAVKNDIDVDVLKMRYIEGKTLKECGEVQGTTLDTCRQREVRAMRKLRSNRNILQIGHDEGIIDISRERKRRRTPVYNRRSLWDDMTDEERDNMRMLI